MRNKLNNNIKLTLTKYITREGEYHFITREAMNNFSSSMNSLEWRRSKVQGLASQGYNQSNKPTYY